MTRKIACYIILILSVAWPGHAFLHATQAGQTDHIADDLAVAMPSIAGPEVHIDTIFLEGNRLTRDRIILRELLFRPGDHMGPDELTQKIRDSRSNLMNTGLFNFVEIQIDDARHPSLKITFTFIERWNIWPIPVFELDKPNLNQWLSDPSFSKINYGINLFMANITGRNERILLAVKAGNEQSINFVFRTPYFDRAQSLRWGIRYGMNRSKQRAYSTEDNQQLFIKSDDYVSNEYKIISHLNYRPEFYNLHSFSIGYHYHDYADTLLLLNPRFGPEGEKRFSFLSFSYHFWRDMRDMAVYPLDGYLVEGGITRKGLRLLPGEIMDVTTLRGTIRYYIPLARRWYTAWSINGKWSEGTTLSYFDQQGLGFSGSLVRGYENHVIDGHKYLIIKSNVKYKLLPERVSKLGFIPSKKFNLIHYAMYLNFFVDAGIINDRHYNDTSQLANKWLAGTGLGLDFHTYYDMVLRTELTINRHGKAGVYFHVAAPI